MDEVSHVSWRPGLLIGINFSDYDWEKNQQRVFEIDHIVQTMASPEGTNYITQSSSGGNGVNRMAMKDLLSGKIERLRAANRLHVVDLFAVADLQPPGPGPTPQATPQALELPELDVSETPAG